MSTEDPTHLVALLCCDCHTLASGDASRSQSPGVSERGVLESTQPLARPVTQTSLLLLAGPAGGPTFVSMFPCPGDLEIVGTHTPPQPSTALCSAAASFHRHCSPSPSPWLPAPPPPACHFTQLLSETVEIVLTPFASSSSSPAVSWKLHWTACLQSVQPKGFLLPSLPSAASFCDPSLHRAFSASCIPGPEPFLNQPQPPELGLSALPLPWPLSPHPDPSFPAGPSCWLQEDTQYNNAIPIGSPTPALCGRCGHPGGA